MYQVLELPANMIYSVNETTYLLRDFLIKSGFERELLMLPSWYEVLKAARNYAEEKHLDEDSTFKLLELVRKFLKFYFHIKRVGSSFLLGIEKRSSMTRLYLYGTLENVVEDFLRTESPDLDFTINEEGEVNYDEILIKYTSPYMLVKTKLVIFMRGTCGLGKSTFARELMDMLETRGLSVGLVSQDDFNGDKKSALMAVKLYLYQCDIVIIDNNSPNMEIMGHYLTLLGEDIKKVFIEPDMESYLTEILSIVGTQIRYNSVHGGSIELKTRYGDPYSAMIDRQSDRVFSDSSFMYDIITFFLNSFKKIDDSVGTTINFPLWNIDLVECIERQLREIILKITREPLTEEMIDLPLLRRSVPNFGERNTLMDFISKGVTNLEEVPENFREIVKSILSLFNEARLTTDEQIDLVMPYIENFL